MPARIALAAALLAGCAHTDPARAAFAGTYAYAWSEEDTPFYGTGRLALSTDGTWSRYEHVGGYCRGMWPFARRVREDWKGRWRVDGAEAVLHRNLRVDDRLRLVSHDGRTWLLGKADVARLCVNASGFRWEAAWALDGPTRPDAPSVDALCHAAARW